jgi:hypothetical protein
MCWQSLIPGGNGFSFGLVMATRGNRRRQVRAAFSLAAVALVFAAGFLPLRNAMGQDTNGFPDPSEVFQGRTFKTELERDVFFLQQIRERYPQHWPLLLAANITVGNYVVTPEKLRRFVQEVGAAAENSDDPAAVASVAAVVTNAEIYTNAAQPEVLQAVVGSLIKIGPKGRLALAGAFNETHYRADPESLEVLADNIGKAGVSDTNLSAALAATAFTFTATNGGSYPRCTKEAVWNLLCLTNGVTALRPHLNTNEIFKDPGRFQSVVDGIAEAHADALATNLDEIAAAIKTKLTRLAPGRDPYRDDLTELQTRLQQTMERLRTTAK